VSSKRNDSPEFPLCRFAFADGRHCALPARPHHDGLCPPHFAALNRRTKPRNPARRLSRLSSNPLNEAEVLQIISDLKGAIASQTISPNEAATMTYIGNVLLSCLRASKEAAFREGAGSDWDAIRKLLDDRDTHPVLGSS
jgi:hypothetical protein